MTRRNNNMIANRYLATHHIGQGGMADVFLAHDTILNREVAVKILRGELSNDPVALLRFQQEAQASTALSHPNIVDIYDVGEDRGHHFIVMEYIRGTTLKNLIKRRGALLKEEAQDIMKQITSAIVEAHKRGIIHRDIKPQNILVKADGTIKVVDFGIALAQNSLQLTQKDSVMGSVHYLAPELARGEQASAQSDIYALGIVLFELLSGDVPFKGEQAVEIALKHMREPIPDIKTINPDIPQAMSNIILKACAKNKNNRYRSAQEMLNDITTCLSPKRQNERPPLFDYEEHSGKTRMMKKVDERNMDEHEHKSRRPVKKKKKFDWLALIVVLLSMLSLAGIYFALSLTGAFKPAASLEVVPNLLDQTVTSAKELCTENNLQLDTANIVYELTDEIEKGLIFEVEPSVGSEVPKGTKIQVKVSSGIGVYLDNYVGMNINDAKKQLANYPNMHVLTSEESSDTYDPGTVIRQELMEPQTRFNPNTNTEIRLVYASYPSVIIPNEIQDMNIDEARALLEGMGLQVVLSNLDTSGLTQEEIDNLSTGIVIKSNPEIGQSYVQTDSSYVTLYYY
ncbi:MAG: Stk1 family PASTA domain-containing Ser/Thr kinase [Erysipelotrichaceae bacterium]|nr:Stk1 family PASTA domain-containing Ser/Thr kinase [Erysipelotrichaceae bacterium]MDY5252237.1 Stk1 family PASTA domain-containing Ser/Thr kinase [Erysipelotrichaceae bacterium]